MKVHITTYTLLLFIALLPAACSTADDDTAAPTAVALSAVIDTRAGAAAAVAHPHPKFIFWLQSDYDADNLGTTFDAQVVTAGATLGSGTSYATTTPSDNIEYYTALKYNLGRAYPDDGSIIYATGYWPSTLTPSTDNKTLTVPDAVRQANTDILVAKQLVQGSKGSPFSQPLSFGHACVQLSFKALRASPMTNFVDNIYVQTLEMPGLLEWTSGTWPDSRYVAHRQLDHTDAVGMTASEWDNNFPKVGPNVMEGTTGSTNKAQLDKSTWRDIDGALYIAPGNGIDDAGLTAVWLRITYDTSTSQDFSTTTANTAIVEVPIVTTDGEGALQGGDAYTIELTFDDVAINLRAVKTEWQQGGNIILPFLLSE